MRCWLGVHGWGQMVIRAEDGPWMAVNYRKCIRCGRVRAGI